MKFVDDDDDDDEDNNVDSRKQNASSTVLTVAEALKNSVFNQLYVI